MRHPERRKSSPVGAGHHRQVQVLHINDLNNIPVAPSVLVHFEIPLTAVLYSRIDNFALTFPASHILKVFDKLYQVPASARLFSRSFARFLISEGLSPRGNLSLDSEHLIARWLEDAFPDAVRLWEYLFAMRYAKQRSWMTTAGGEALWDGWLDFLERQGNPVRTVLERKSPAGQAETTGEAKLSTVRQGELLMPIYAFADYMTVAAKEFDASPDLTPLTPPLG
ncbi:hypothetical protein JCM10213v2_002107 [Rhodosporidiobolus nylandii]